MAEVADAGVWHAALDAEPAPGLAGLELLPATSPDGGPLGSPARHATRPRMLRAWPDLLVGAAALAVFSWRVQLPSPWRDEAATMAACRRSLAELFALTQNIDRVHLAFYLVTRAALSVYDSLTSARLVSVAAMALAAGLLTSLGRRLAGNRIGLVAGAVFVVLPLVSRWAQDARPAALTTLLAVAATWWLVAATRTPRAWLPWLGYAGCVVALGFVNVLGLLLLGAHGVHLFVTEPMRLVRRWLTAVCFTAIPLGPWLLLTFGQRDQVSWIEPPAVSDLTGLYIHAFGTRLLPVAVVLAALVVLVAGRRIPVGATGRAFVLGAAWCVVPPVVLWTGSLMLPLWDAHYLIFALPGTALLVAATTAQLTGSLRTVGAALAGATVVVAVAVAGIPDHLAYRDAETGHEQEDARGAARYLRTHARPGDVVLFAPITLRNIRATYPEDFASLTDLALARTPAQSASLYGENVPPADLPGRLAGHDRVWLLTRDSDTWRRPDDVATVEIVRSAYREAERTELPGFRVMLYLSDPSARR